MPGNRCRNQLIGPRYGQSVMMAKGLALFCAWIVSGFDTSWRAFALLGHARTLAKLDKNDVPLGRVKAWRTIPSPVPGDLACRWKANAPLRISCAGLCFGKATVNPYDQKPSFVGLEMWRAAFSPRILSNKGYFLRYVVRRVIPQKLGIQIL